MLIENLADAGKIKVPKVTHRVESALVYPYFRGRDVQRWKARESCMYLLTHDPETRQCISESRMRREFPHALEYLSKFKDQLLARATAPLRQAMARGPFYPILGIGPHTIARWKVVFKDLTELFQCCVVGPADSSMPDKPLLPDYTLRLIPADSEDEAHYIAGLLNSAPCVAALYYSSTGVQTQRYHASDAEKVAIARYDASAAQQKIASLSRQCHAAVREDDFERLRTTQGDLDIAAAEYWKISRKALREISDALSVLERQLSRSSQRTSARSESGPPD